jgi:hypothetical protein
MFQNVPCNAPDGTFANTVRKGSLPVLTASSRRIRNMVPPAAFNSQAAQITTAVAASAAMAAAPHVLPTDVFQPAAPITFASINSDIESLLQKPDIIDGLYSASQSIAMGK